MQQQILRFVGFAGENFFGEIIENILFRLLQHLLQIGFFGGGRVVNLIFRNLPNQLQSRNPAVRPGAIFGDFGGFEFEIERRAEQFADFIVGEQQIFAADD